MKFGFNDMGMPMDQLETNLQILADAGYEGLEPTLSLDGALDDPEKLRRLQNLVDEYGLVVPSVLTDALWTYPLSSPDNETREQGIEAATRTIEAGATLGADTMLVVPGVVTADISYDLAYDRALKSVRELAPVADEYEITLAIENVWNDFLLSPLEFATFIDEAAERGPVGAYFDVGNILRYGDPAQWIQILDDRLEKVHVKDYDTEIDTVDGFTYPCHGDVPWCDINDALATVDYDGWITPEVPPYRTCPELMPKQVLETLQAIFCGESRSHLSD